MEDFSRPRLYAVGNDTLKVGKIGGWEKTGSEYIKGYYDLVRDLHWHIDNDKWDYTKDEYLNNGMKITDKLTTINPFIK